MLISCVRDIRDVRAGDQEEEDFLAGLDDNEEDDLDLAFSDDEDSD